MKDTSKNDQIPIENEHVISLIEQIPIENEGYL